MGLPVRRMMTKGARTGKRERRSGWWLSEGSGVIAPRQKHERQTDENQDHA